MKVLKKLSVAILATVFIFNLIGLNQVQAVTTVDLGSTDNFAILGGSTVTNTGSSVITGDLGLSPGSSVTGFPPGTLNGTQHVADTTAVQAKTDLITAYNDAVGQTPVSTVSTELGGTTKTAGIYNSANGTFGLTNTLTLDAEGNPDAVFIFQTASTLITGGSSVVVLTNGAQACNVFWQVGSSATLGANSTFKGNILALTSATLTTGAAVEGRVLARNGAVTLDTNVITRATCVVPPTTTTPTPTETLVPPLISVEKVPTPLALPDGSGSVTYDYTVTNIGTVAINNVMVTDNKCDTVDFVSGDANSDDILDLTETWNYNCTRTVAKTLTNTVTATGEANGFSTTDTANATVVVGVPITPPLIHVVKTPDTFTIPNGGGPVTYTYTVTNPGTVALTNVSVVDNKCSPVTYVSGDTNGSDTLNVSETWTYTCTTDLTGITTNTATAEGSANGFTVIDFAVVTVAEGTADTNTNTNTNTNTDTTTNTNTDTNTDTTTNTNTNTNTDTTTNTNSTNSTNINHRIPDLPDTGLDPAEKNIPWNFIIASIFLLISTSVVVAIRKRTL